MSHLRSYGGEQADEGHGITGTATKFLLTGRRNSEAVARLVSAAETGQHGYSGALCFGVDDLSGGVTLICDNAQAPSVCVAAKP